MEFYKNMMYSEIGNYGKTFFTFEIYEDSINHNLCVESMVIIILYIYTLKYIYIYILKYIKCRSTNNFSIIFGIDPTLAPIIFGDDWTFISVKVHSVMCISFPALKGGQKTCHRTVRAGLWKTLNLFPTYFPFFRDVGQCLWRCKLRPQQPGCITIYQLLQRLTGVQLSFGAGSKEL